MAQFSYKALDANKQVVNGVVSAKDRKEAAVEISRRNLSPLNLKEISEKTTIHGQVPAIDKITFCRYLAVMLSSGLSLSEGINVLYEETKQPLMKRILSDLSYSLEQGQSLSSVFEKYPNVFELYFLTLIRAGEVSGKLSEVFKYLETELKSEYNMRAKIKGALLYPTVVFTAMVGIGFMMFFFVLPQIGKVFLSLKLPLPFITKFLFTASIVLSKQIIPVVLGTIGLVVAAIFAMRNPRFKDLILYLIKPIPIVKDLIKKIDMARFNRIFSTLLKSAVPITEALEISLKLMSWYEYRNLSKLFPEEIRKGKSLAAVIKKQAVFPTLMVQMVAAGEKTGTLDSTLADLASFYEGEVEEELKNLTQIIEPVLMLLVGIAVGAMILSIIAPIYSVVGSFQQAAGGPGAPIK